MHVTRNRTQGDFMDYLGLIRRHASAAGLSVHALFVRAGVSPQQYGRWKRGETEPRLKTLRQLFAVPPVKARKRK